MYDLFSLTEVLEKFDKLCGTVNPKTGEIEYQAWALPFVQQLQDMIAKACTNTNLYNSFLFLCYMKSYMYGV